MVADRVARRKPRPKAVEGQGTRGTPYARCLNTPVTSWPVPTPINPRVMGRVSPQKESAKTFGSREPHRESRSPEKKVHYRSRDENDELRPRAGGHDVEAVEAHEELILVRYLVGVAQGLGGDYHAPLLALKSFDGVHGAPDRITASGSGGGAEESKGMARTIRNAHALPEGVLETAPTAGAKSAA